jgi:hypothetical protein
MIKAYTSLFLSSGIVYQLRGDHDSALKLHQVNNNGPLIGEYIWSKSDGDITVRKLREQ